VGGVNTVGEGTQPARVLAASRACCQGHSGGVLVVVEACVRQEGGRGGPAAPRSPAAASPTRVLKKSPLAVTWRFLLEAWHESVRSPGNIKARPLHSFTLLTQSQSQSRCWFPNCCCSLPLSLRRHACRCHTPARPCQLVWSEGSTTTIESFSAACTSR
jgi:hypothetical protein